MGNNSKDTQQAKILSFYPTGDYYYKKGVKAFQRQDLYQAKKYLQRALELEPDEPMIACELAMVCTELGEYQFSNQLLEKVLQDLDPFMTECHYFLANNFAHLGLFQEAYKHANKYLEIEEYGEFSEDAEDLLDLITFEGEENEDGFLEDDLMMRQDKARNLLETGKFAQAVEALEELISVYPEFWAAYNNLALAYFYVGKIEDAFATLDRVLEKDHGNLHALCNRLVFYHYQMNEEKIDEMVEMLGKIRPLLPESRLKLGATFALTGHYDLAYQWLRQLQKWGFNGDGTFYYWLSKSAYHLGNEQVARSAWVKVIQLSPEKEGLEPWGEVFTAESGFEHHVPSIIKKLESEHQEERLFGLFLTKHSNAPAKVKMNEAYAKNNRFSTLEAYYKKNISKPETYTFFADEVAELLYNRYQPVQLVEAGLYLLWFSVFVEGKGQGVHFSNASAWAAAVDYEWHKLRDEKRTQKEVADLYSISVSTLGKYSRYINQFLQ